MIGSEILCSCNKGVAYLKNTCTEWADSKIEIFVLIKQLSKVIVKVVVCEHLHKC